jgi:hypothetical protein
VVLNERSKVAQGGRDEALLGFCIKMRRKTGTVKDGDFKWIGRMENPL